MVRLVSPASLRLPPRTLATHDLLHNLAGRVKVNQSLVDSQLVSVPRLGTFTAWRLSGRVREGLGGQTNGSLDAELLVLGSRDEIRADCERTSSGGQSSRTPFHPSAEPVAHSPFSRFLTFLLVRVIRILWIWGAGALASTSLSLAT